jgi:4-hydroxybenzoate polyprenyltransferase
VKQILLLLRPNQWLKNTFIFLPLFFNQKIGDPEFLIPALVAFIVFSFAASSIYCLNDIIDVEADRLHLKKCNRPIASGAVSRSTGYILMFVLITVASVLTLLYFQEKRWIVLGVILTYYFMNIGYSIGLKNYALVDVFIISIGFVLRILMGGFSTGIYISHWIVLMTFLLALFLAFAKRRDDLVIFEESGIKPRKNISRYNLDFLNQTITIIASITMVSYVMYTVSEEVTNRMHTEYLYVTSVFVLAGILRYLQLTIVDVKSGNPTEVLMKDRFIQATIAGWLISFFIIIYI